jgi:hypothetical protein
MELSLADARELWDNLGELLIMAGALQVLGG